VRFLENVPDLEGKGACKDEDPELFFPIGSENTPSSRAQIEEAKAVCRGCEVASVCLQYALEQGEVHGVWGGRSEGERRALARRMARTRRVG